MVDGTIEPAERSAGSAVGWPDEPHEGYSEGAVVDGASTGERSGDRTTAGGAAERAGGRGHGGGAGTGPGVLDRAVAARWRRVAERWSPSGLRGARTDPGRRGAAALIVLAVVAAAVVALVAWHDRPRPEPITPPAVVAGPDQTTSAGPRASAAPLVVAVTGRVRRPGVVTVPAGSRVIDAVKAAGGPLPGTDLALLNLARKLADGELVTVGAPPAAPAAGDPAAAPPAGGGSGAVVDLNTATLADLDTLPGVGPVLAQRILDWRTEHGPFATVDQLGEVPGIGDSRLAQLRDLVRV